MPAVIQKSGTSKRKLQEEYKRGYADGMQGKDLSLTYKIGDFSGDQNVAILNHISAETLASYGLTTLDLTSDNFYIVPKGFAADSSGGWWTEDDRIEQLNVTAHETGIVYTANTATLSLTGMYQRVFWRWLEHGSKWHDMAKQGALSYELYLRWSQPAQDYVDKGKAQDLAENGKVVGAINCFAANSEKSRTGGGSVSYDSSYCTASGTSLTIARDGRYRVTNVQFGAQYNWSYPATGDFNYVAGTVITLIPRALDYGSNDGGCTCAILRYLGPMQ